MKIDFFGGTDVQKSLNHSDNKCINLIPALNDKGDIAAFYGAHGLALEATNPSSEVGSGIYTASNGRCFEVAGTTLYELTEVNGVITTTSRGTVTSASIYRMSDNGIELMLVNGIDGWLFTFATNTLKKIKVKSADFTVTIANPAVFTSVGHTLEAGDPVRLTTTTGSVLSNSILDALVPSTVSAQSNTMALAVAPANDFVYAIRPPGGGTGASLQMYLKNTASYILSPLSPPTLDLTGYSPNDIKISSDGISAYVTSDFFLDLVVMLSVNITTGQVSIATPATIATGVSPNSITLSPDDKFAYVTNSGDNTVSQYSRNLGTGELSALTPATISVGTLPQEIVIGTNAAGTVSFAYVSNKTANTITVHARNVTTGLLTSTPAQTISCGGLSPMGLAISPETNNPHLYVVNNGSGNVAMFSRDATTGLLTALSPATVSTGTSPQKISIPADADSVYVTNSADNTVSMFNRDNSTGILTATSTPTIATGSTPVGIVTAPDGNSVYVANSGASTISMFSRNATAETVGLPTGLATLTTYYVLAAGLTADAFELSETAGGTAVSTSGKQAGVHTFTTLGYGFPEGAKTVAYMNGRFVCCEQGTQNFFVSEVLDGKWWDALNVQTVDSNPDNVVGEVVSHNELIVFCEDSGEVFYDSGTTPSPFVRNSSGIFETGCVSPYSIVVLDNTVYWLGGNKEGQGIVYRLNGFTPTRISTHSIETIIQGMTDISDARAFAYQQDGHHYYVLTFPTGDKTYVFDVNTGLWHERANFSGGVFSRWEAQEHAFFANKHLVLDYAEGKIYSIDPDTYTYGTEVKKWVRSFRVQKGSMNREVHTRLQLDCEVGVGIIGSAEPQAVMRFSDDGGHTWSGEIWKSMGAIGDFTKRVVWHRLGMTKYQPRTYEISGSDPVKIALLNAHLD